MMCVSGKIYKMEILEPTEDPLNSVKAKLATKPIRK